MMCLTVFNFRGILTLLLVIITNDIVARSWRVSQIPNGNINGCRTCHNSSYRSLNAFGIEVRSLVGRGSTASFWTSILAAKDSDGDGASNGQELGDIDGDGVSTIPRSEVTNPGDSKSKPKKSDTDPPVITLNGNSELTLEAGSDYTELGAKATDSEDGDLSSSIQVTGEVDTKNPGTYEIFYDVKDKSGNEAITLSRTVFVVDTTSPVITLVGDSMITIEVGSKYEDNGATAKDIVDGDLSSLIKVTGEVNANRAGNYQLTYAVTDAAGNAASAKIRSVRVIKQNPTIVWQNPKAIIYGDKLSDVQLNPTSNVEGRFEFSHNQQDVLSAGKHILKADFYPSNQDKYVGVSKEVAITVEKAPLTISVESVSRLTNQQNPKFIISYDGFVNNETKYDLISLAVAGTDATVSSQAGTYPITLGGATSDNYEINYTNGVITITEKFRLTIDVNGSGEVKVNPDKEFYDLGEKVTLEAVPSKGYAFASWEGLQIASDNPLEIITTQDMTLKVSFAKLVRYTGVVIEGNGDIVITPKLDLYPAGSPIEVFAVPAKNYVFEKWTMKGLLLSKNNPLTTSKVPSSDMAIEAHFKYVKPAEPEEVKISDIVMAPYGFSFNTELGTAYQVQASNDLREWKQIREVNGTGALVKFVDLRKAYYEKQYYRVRVLE